MTIWEEKFKPVNTTSCGRRIVRKHREIKNVEQYITLDISFDLDFLDKREVATSESRDYMGRSGNGLINYMALSIKIPKKKEKARVTINDITNHYFGNFLKEFKNSTYLGYKDKQVHNEPTED